MGKELNTSNTIPIRPKVLFSSRKERLFLLYFNIFLFLCFYVIIYIYAGII